MSEFEPTTDKDGEAVCEHRIPKDAPEIILHALHRDTDGEDEDAPKRRMANGRGVAL